MLRTLAASALTVGIAATAFAPATAAPFDDDFFIHHMMSNCREGAPIVVGHRGASGYRPEHTLASYRLAAEMGADYIEPDLVSTKDGVLVARHENDITGTTDVAERPEFADRKTTKTIDGSEHTGWFTEDFTLAELKTLRAVERLPQVRPENTAYDGQFEVATFQEVLQLREELSKELGREIGVYPETKHPTYFQSIGLDLEAPLVADLEAFGLNRKDAPVFVQSFELTNLMDLQNKLGLKANTVFLIWKNGAPFDLESKGDSRDFAFFATRLGLTQLATHGIDGVGPEMSLVINWNEDGTLGKQTNLVKDAHRVGMQVHAYTFRAENRFLPVDYREGDDLNADGRVEDLEKTYLEAGLDGFFTDMPDSGVKARNDWWAAHTAK